MWSSQKRIHFSFPGRLFPHGVSSSSPSVLLSRMEQTPQGPRINRRHTSNICFPLPTNMVTYTLSSNYHNAVDSMTNISSDCDLTDSQSAKSRIFLAICDIGVLSKEGFFPFLRLLGHLFVFHHDLSLFFYHTGDGLDLNCREEITELCLPQSTQHDNIQYLFLW